MGSTGVSSRNREERRFEQALEMLSDRLPRTLTAGGKGDLERDVERELWVDGPVREGTWVERESRRERPCIDQGLEGVTFDRLPTGSGVDVAVAAPGIATAGVEVKLRGLSRGKVCCLRKEAALSDGGDAARSPGDEAQCVREGGTRLASPVDAR
jgi:hypothetical protein